MPVGTTHHFHGEPSRTRFAASCTSRRHVAFRPRKNRLADNSVVASRLGTLVFRPISQKLASIPDVLGEINSARWLGY